MGLLERWWIGVGMRGRRIWALLVVLAVLGMHGVQCAGGMVDQTHAPHAAVGGTDSRTTASAVDGHHVGAPHAPSRPSHSDPDVPPVHGAQVWTVCLAVAFAALALVGVATLLRGRAALLVRGPPPGTRVFRRRYRLPAAPDLSTLCLLRI